MTELFPSTLEELREEGARFSDLYLQGGWGRAALAYGCTTTTSKGGRPKRDETSPRFPMSVKAFSALAGLNVRNRRVLNFDGVNRGDRVLMQTAGNSLKYMIQQSTDLREAFKG